MQLSSIVSIPEPGVAKKSHKSKPTKPQPESAQIKAIERLLEADENAKAAQRLRPLIQKFPDHGGLRRLLVAALDQSDERRAAGLAAFEWAESRPNSVTAQETLLFFALDLGHIMLADHTARHLRALGVETRGFPLPPEMLAKMLEMPDGTTATVEQMRRFDIGKIYMDAMDFAGTIKRLEGLELMSARNNRATSLFHLGRVDESLAEFMAGWEADADNLFALAWSARLRLYRGDEEGARGLGTPLGAATARRIDDAIAQLDGLLLLGQNRLARDAFKRYAKHHGFAEDGGYPLGMLHHFAACAASRLGDMGEARRLWRQARDLAPELNLASANLTDLERHRKAPEYPSIFDQTRAFPLTLMDALRAGGQEHEVEEKLHGLANAADVFLETLYLSGDQLLRRLIGILLKHRASKEDSDTTRLLKRFASLPIGTKEDRFDFLRALKEKGLIEPKTLLDYWDGTKITQVNLFGIEIIRDTEEPDLPADLHERLGESIERFNAGDYAEAEALLNHILARVPDHPSSRLNLSVIRARQGRQAEAHEMMKQIVADNPDYLCARCNLANLEILNGRPEEARKLLDGLAKRERIHIDDLFILNGSMALLHRARGDLASADALLANLEQLVETEDDERHLRFAMNLQNSIEPGTGLINNLRKLILSTHHKRKR